MSGRIGAGDANGDLLAPRRGFVAAAATALAVCVAIALTPWSRVASPGPLSRAHVAADVKCAACHVDRVEAAVAVATCVGCHGDHRSTRSGHRAVQRDLGCPSCHTAHGAAEAVTVGTGAVARVAMSSCARCHDLARPDDPARACAGKGEWADMSVCLDEHQEPGAPLALRGVCAREHGPARFVAWEQARRPGAATLGTAARSEPWRGEGLWLGSGGGVGVLVLVGGAVARRMRRRAPPARLPRVAVVPHPHVRLPRIDATTCLGCQACVDACPFDALAVDRHLAVLARPDSCCGAGVCEGACPNGSLRIVEQDEPVHDRPRVDEHLESLDRPGLFVAGDLTGVPLIRSAIAQGAAVADRVAATVVPRERAGEDRASVDLVVVGAGPAGLSAALRAGERGLSCVVLEQSELAASIRAFPRGKIVHDAPIELPVEGRLWFRQSTREELVAHWTRVVRTHRIDVREHHRVTRIEATATGFVVSAESRAGLRPFPASRVLMATGRRGTPRQLEAVVAPGARGLVTSALSDARAWAGKRVLIVGLGDAALEAIVALARQPATVVTVSYRGRTFARGSARNIDAVRRLADAGRIQLRLGTQVIRVDAGEVTLQGPTGMERVRVDGVLALLGGEPGRALLSAAGVRMT